MTSLIVLPTLALLIAGFMSLIVFAIVRKKWALLFIPLGLGMLLAVFVVLGYVSHPTPVIQGNEKVDLVLAFPIAALLVIGFLAPITIAIRRKKWALLFIPLGLVMLFTVLAGLHFVSSSVSHPVSKTVVSTRVQPQHIAHEEVVYNPVQPMEYSVDSSIKVTRNQPNVVHFSRRTMLAPVGMILLIGLLGLVGLVVFAIVRNKWAVLFIPLGVAGLAVIAVLALRFVAMPTHSSNVYTQIETPDRNASPDHNYSIAADKPLPAVWSPGMEKEFQADVYYSRSAAFRALAEQLAKMFREMVVNSQQVPDGLAFVTGKEDAEALAIFQEVLPDIKCYSGHRKNQDGTVNFMMKIRPARKSELPKNLNYNQKDYRRGDIRAAIQSKNISRSFSAQFTEKPWLENFSAFNNSYPNRQFAIAYSPQAGVSHDDARHLTFFPASQIVSNIIIESMQMLGNQNSGVTLTMDDFYTYGIIADDFSQSFKGSATPIYRHAFLLDVSPDRIMPLAQQKVNGYNAARQDWAYHIMSAIGIALVICVIYLILNAATKGYYTVVLRILTVIGIIAVVLLLTMV